MNKNKRIVESFEEFTSRMDSPNEISLSELMESTTNSTFERMSLDRYMSMIDSSNNGETEGFEGVESAWHKTGSEELLIYKDFLFNGNLHGYGVTEFTVDGAPNQMFVLRTDMGMSSNTLFVTPELFDKLGGTEENWSDDGMTRVPNSNSGMQTDGDISLDQVDGR